MTFEDWFVSEGYATWDDAFEVAQEAWDYQQDRIDELEHKVALRDAFIAGLQFKEARESTRE